MNRNRLLLSGLIVVLTVPWPCLGHGGAYEVLRDAGGIRAVYDDGSPMALCDVSVFAPDRPEEAYQTGITDPHGRFAFVPDTHGMWRVTVDDGMGHRVEAAVPVDSAFGHEHEHGHEHRHAAGRLSGLVVGISVIFGLFGVLALLSRKRGAAGNGPNQGGVSCTLPKA